ncbi:MAG: tetratricopeptide repeat protein [Phycisphaerae bacterium]
MNEADRQRIKDLFNEAVSQPQHEREAWLKEQVRQGLCNEKVYEEVSSLLEHDLPEQDVELESQIGQLRSAIADVAGAEVEHPQNIGPYEILGLVGTGGMGYVYRAQQTNPRRTVALKVMRPDLADENNLRRFQLEAQALARLQHPGIAHIYETGITNDKNGFSQPYLAMELIDGRDIMDHAQHHGLTHREIFALVADICDALQHAHARGVIHRDLKPANIIVDQQGIPKILDFGVSRLTDDDGPAVTQATNRGHFIGTVPYMSPEQIAGQSADLDTRTDIYSLGVVLFELLTGSRPHDLQNLSLMESARKITETQPGKVTSYLPELRGDPDIIVATALEQDRQDRYQNASDFARDLRNYLQGKPILAHPPSAFYQMKKFTARNKALAVSIAMVFLALSLGMTASTWFALQARQAEAEKEAQYKEAVQAKAKAEEKQLEAQQQADIAQAVNEFLNDDLLAAADPMRTSNRQLTVRQAVDAAEEKVTKAFQDQPLIEAAIRMTLGQTYRNLGEYAKSISNLERALEIRLREREPSHADVAETRLNLARTLTGAGRFNEAEELYRQVLTATAERFGPESGESGVAQNDLGMLLVTAGRFTEGLPILEEALQRCTKHLGETNEATLAALNNLAVANYQKGDYQQAWNYQRQAFEKQEATVGSDHPNTMRSMMNLGFLAETKGDFETAEQWYDQAMQRQIRVLGTEHHQTLDTMRNLALLYDSQQRYEKAIELNRATLEGYMKAVGPDHQHTATTLGNLAGSLAAMEQYDEAEQKFLQSLKIYKAIHGNDSYMTAVCMNNIALMYQKMKAHDNAANMLQECVSIYEKSIGPEHRYTLIARNNLARSLTALEKLDDAQICLEQTLKIAQSTLNEDDKLIGETRILLARNHMARQEWPQAEELALPTWNEWSKTLEPDHPYTQRARTLLEELYTNWNKPEKAAEFSKP